MPDAVDLSSTVEQSPGIKDHQKLRDFFATLEKVAVKYSWFSFAPAMNQTSTNG
jgi:hypothetical protein